MRKRQRGELDRNKNRKVRGRKTGQDRHDRTNCGCSSADTNHLCVGVSVYLCVCVCWHELTAEECNGKVRNRKSPSKPWGWHRPPTGSHTEPGIFQHTGNYRVDTNTSITSAHSHRYNAFVCYALWATGVTSQSAGLTLKDSVIIDSVITSGKYLLMELPAAAKTGLGRYSEYTQIIR